MLLVLFMGAAHGQQFSAWSAPVNLGPIVNSEFGDLAPSISKDGLSLYFFSDRPGGFGGNDIWVSHRSGVDAPWGPPKNLGPNINTSADENAPTLSLDGHKLYFASDRPGGYGGLDLYISRRHDKRDDFGWRCPENLDAGVNTLADEASAAVFEVDETGATTLYFHSNRDGDDNIYASALSPEEIFGPAMPVNEINSPFADRVPSIRRDGLEFFLASNRPGTIGALDLWVSTRAKISDPWSTPVDLGPVVNSKSVDGRAFLSFEGTTMYFNSNRPGGSGAFDLYMCTRSKLRGSD
jgi:hypothetical protein